MGHGLMGGPQGDVRGVCCSVMQVVTSAGILRAAERGRHQRAAPPKRIDGGEVDCHSYSGRHRCLQQAQKQAIPGPSASLQQDMGKGCVSSASYGTIMLGKGLRYWHKGEAKMSRVKRLRRWGRGPLASMTHVAWWFCAKKRCR